MWITISSFLAEVWVAFKWLLTSVSSFLTHIPVFLLSHAKGFEPYLLFLGKIIAAAAVIAVPLLNMWREARRQNKQLKDQQEANAAIKENAAHVPMPAALTSPMMQMYGDIAQIDGLRQAVKENTSAVNRQTNVIEQLFAFLKDAAANGAQPPSA